MSAANSAGAASTASAASAASGPNMARLNGPFQEHSLGNLLNARSKAETRLRNARLSATHDANRTMIDSINRHIGFRRNQSRRVEAAAAERRRATLATRLAEEEASAAGTPLAPLPVVHVRSNGVGPYYTSQFRETGVKPKKRRTRRARR
jgi:hypothetical protein